MIIVHILIFVQNIRPNDASNFVKPLNAVVSEFLKGVVVMCAVQKGKLLGVFKMFVYCELIDSLSSNASSGIVPEDVEKFFLRQYVKDE